MFKTNSVSRVCMCGVKSVEGADLSASAINYV